MFLLSPEADMDPGDLQTQFLLKEPFGWVIRMGRQRQSEGTIADLGFGGAATPGHWPHTDYRAITRKPRLFSRRQSAGFHHLCRII
jgi:hypothetical protein